MGPIPYGKQHITEEDIREVIRTLKSEYLTQGPVIEQFEKAFANYTGAKYAVAVSNGTAALHLSALALEVKKGESVITTPITFAASANCIQYCGGEVLFADIDPTTYLIDIQALRKKLESPGPAHIKGIIVVDFAGHAANMEAFRKIADEFGLWIIEDACHAPGAFFTDSTNKKQLCGNGNFADLTVFSFHPVKHITTGEGGMIVTNNQQLYERLLVLRTHGITKNPAILDENHGGWYYEMQELGYNYRLTDFQCALGLSQLKRADENIALRQKIASNYAKAFSNSSIVIPSVEKNSLHAFHLYVIKTKDRLGLYNHLKSKNIHAQVHYIPVHLQPYYKQLGFKKGDFPVAESYYEECLSLPMYPTLSEAEQNYVIDEVLTYLS